MKQATGAWRACNTNRLGSRQFQRSASTRIHERLLQEARQQCHTYSHISARVRSGRRGQKLEQSSKCTIQLRRYTADVKSIILRSIRERRRLSVTKPSKTTRNEYNQNLNNRNVESATEAQSMPYSAVYGDGLKDLVYALNKRSWTPVQVDPYLVDQISTGSQLASTDPQFELAIKWQYVNPHQAFAAHSLMNVFAFARAADEDPTAVVKRAALLEDYLLDGGTRDKINYEHVSLSETPQRLTIRRILASYMDFSICEAYMQPETRDLLLLRIFDDASVAYLHDHNYTVEDVVAWAWMLEPHSSAITVPRFLLWTNQPPPANTPPFFVFQSLFERTTHEPAVLDLLLDHLSCRLKRTRDPTWKSIYENFPLGSNNIKVSQRIEVSTSQQDQPNEEDSVTDPQIQADTILYGEIRAFRFEPIIWRFLHLARVTMPELLPKIASVICEYDGYLKSESNEREDGYGEGAMCELTRMYNDVLIKCAEQTIRPYLSASYQERAQFILIRRMNEFQPPLGISADAYRAIISIQLRHRKTLKDRQWAQLKSRAWPPYREDKLGIDALKKAEVYGTSRAQQAIHNLHEAGYTSNSWEDAASILSGWDIDRSPTIQTRKVLPVIARAHDTNDSSIWWARISATHTVEEAWSCFLDYMHKDTRRERRVFMVMYEKIAREQLRKAAEKTQSLESQALPGDMPETWASSRNPRDMVYTSTSPPDKQQFYSLYKTHFPKLNTEALIGALRFADSLQEGFGFIEDSDLPLDTKRTFQGLETEEHRLELDGSLGTLFLEMIRLYSRFPDEHLPGTLTSSFPTAIDLVRSQKPLGGGAWMHLVTAMATIAGKPSRNGIWLEDWQLLMRILADIAESRIPVDSEMLYVICIALKRFMWFACQDYADEEQQMTSTVVKRLFSQMVSPYRGAVFSNIDGLNASQPLGDAGLPKGIFSGSLLPSLLYLPSPQAMHACIRLLGLLQDQQAVVDLIKWISTHNKELQSRISAASRNGRHFRYILVAARIALESHSRPFMDDTLRRFWSLQSDAATPRALEAKDIVESIPNWGGWPSDKEVIRYLDTGA